jgi:hypothetical protein
VSLEWWAKLREGLAVPLVISFMAKTGAEPFPDGREGNGLGSRSRCRIPHKLL